MNFFKKRNRASVLLFSVVILVSTGLATVSWLGYMSHAQRAAARDRARIQALNAAEAGIEQVVDFCNNPSKYTMWAPAYKTQGWDTSPYTIKYNYYKNNGDLAGPVTMAQELNVGIFAPYILGLRVNGDNVPVDAKGEDVTTNTGGLNAGWAPNQRTFLRSQTDRLSSKIPTFVVYDKSVHRTNFVQNKDDRGNLRGEVTRVVFIHPKDFGSYGEAAPPPNARVVGKIISTATTPENVTVTVESILTENGAVLITSPGAIISHDGIAFNGQFNAFWGMVYSKGDIHLLNPFLSKINDSSEDPWLKIQTKGYLKDSTGANFANGAANGGWGGSAPTGSRLTVPFYFDNPHDRLHTSIRGTDYEKYLHLSQISTYEPPKMPYADFRNFFLAYGLPYYFTDKDGNIYGTERNKESEDYGKIVSKSFADWFHADVSADNLANYWDIEQMLAFVDGPPVNDDFEMAFDSDGIPIRNSEYYSRDPQDPTYADNLDDIMATVSHGGSGSSHTRGLIMMANNLQWAGGGSPPQFYELLDQTHTSTIPNPYFRTPDGASNCTTCTGNPNSKKNRQRFIAQYNGGNNPTPINHNGIMYTFGHMTNSGSVSVYGSMVAELGYRGNGSREVWYNYRLANGTWLNVNQSYVRRNQWAIRSATVPNVTAVAVSS